MELELSPQQHQNHGSASAQKAKRSKAPGIRVVGNRIYDPANGITCHQCRQKTRDFAASCKNLKDGKPCVIKFCHKCLKNRYGEKAEEVELLEDWKCPKCRNFCNCSCCMKRRGQKPTGQLVHTAKASGYKSVSEMLRLNTAESLEKGQVNNTISPVKKSALKKDAMIARVNNSSCGKVLMSKAVSCVKPIASEKELVVDISGEPGKENSLDGKRGSKLESLKAQKTSREKSRKTQREGLKEISNGKSIDDACKNKRPKRAKICNEAPEEEKKRNADDGVRASNEVSTKEVKVNKNQGIIHVEGPMIWASKDFSFNPNKKDVKEKRRRKANTVFHEETEKEMKVDSNHDTSYGKMNGPEAWGANDFLLHPSTWATNDAFFKPNQPEAKEDMYKKIQKGAAVFVDDDNAVVKPQTAGIGGAPKVRTCTVNCERKEIQVEVPLPTGTVLTEISGIEFQPEDVGSALQFLEFCRSFGKVLDVKKGEAESIIRELVRKQNLRRAQNTLVVQFHIRLLTLIDSGTKSPSLTNGSGKNSWLKALEDLISGSELVLKGFPLDWLEEGIGGYHNLDLSKKLSLLNFLCDEVLCTEKLRSYIDDQNVRFAEEKKEAKSKVAAAKEKEKGLKQKLQDEVAKAIISNGAPLSIAEHDALVSKIKGEAAQALAEVLEAKGTIPKGKQYSDTMRTEPVFLHGTRAFWKLRSYNGEYAVLLQDVKMEDATAATADERWFVYGPEKKDEIDKYISSRARRPKIHKVTSILLNEGNEANI